MIVLISLAIYGQSGNFNLAGSGMEPRQGERVSTRGGGRLILFAVMLVAGL